MEEKKENEFENLGTEETVPEQEFSEVPGGQDEDLIGGGAGGQEYDWSKAPDSIKAPPRKDLDGQVVTIKKASLVLPPMESKWDLTRAGDKKFKFCIFKLFYDIDGQQEFFSGVRVFENNEKYSHPSIPNDRKNQASELKGLYADFRKKDINEVSLKEFMGFLNGQPKAKIKVREIKNPKNQELIRKNLIGEFVE